MHLHGGFGDADIVGNLLAAEIIILAPQPDLPADRTATRSILRRGRPRVVKKIGTGPVVL